MTFLENVDKAKLQKILLITISALMLVALALLLVIVIMSIDPANPGKNLDYKEYALTSKDAGSGNLVLADDKHPFSYGYAEDELEAWGAYRDANCEKNEAGKNINNYYMNDKSKMHLTTAAMKAAHKMLVAAEAAVKKDDILISYTYGYNEKDAAEYETALMFALTNFESGKIDAAYTEWLTANAANYGFIAGTVEDSYRYVGVAHAKYMTENKLSLANYLAYLKDNTTHDNGLTITVGEQKYYVYYVTATAGDVIKVPAENAYTISGTNEGGVIVTVTLSK